MTNFITNTMQENKNFLVFCKNIWKTMNKQTKMLTITTTLAISAAYCWAVTAISILSM